MSKQPTSAATLQTKTCSKCSVVKPIDEFYWRNDQQRYRADCKACVREASYSSPTHGKYRKLNYDASMKNRLRRYGITPEDAQKLWETQSGKCAICGEQMVGHGYKSSVKGAKAHLDHSHKTGRVRGYLCGNCNRGMGYLGDSIENLRSAILYLTHHAYKETQ